MRVFVSEYVCGGAWPEENLDSSLAIEGRAMLLSLIEELLRIPGVEVVTTWDYRLGEFPIAVSSRCEVVQTSSPIEEQQAFERLCKASDAAFVIAPEFHGILAPRVETASSRTRLIGCDIDSTTLCSDKLKLAEFLNAKEIPTVPTESFDPVCIENLAADGESGFPCVIKPRDGAGSLLTFKVSSSDELAGRSKQLLTDGEGFSFVQQPFIEGVAVSCAAIVNAGQGNDSKGPRIDVLPPCQQILSSDRCLSYVGAEFPIRSDHQHAELFAGESVPDVSPSFLRRREPSSRHTGLDSRPRGNDSVRVEQIERLVRRCCCAIPGLSGYVGFDLLIPHGENADPAIVEINPRLTTGFLLWRKMCNDNLAARMLDLATGGDSPSKTPLSWKSGEHSIRISSLLG
jgi:hypothetical protein